MSSETVRARCNSKTKTGAQCKKYTLKGPKCWLHAVRELNLRVKKSGIPNAGMGLFAGPKPFQKNQKIDRYVGKHLLDSGQVDRSKSAYILQLSKDEWIDAGRTNSCFARYANAPKGTKKLANAKLRGYHQKHEGTLKASIKILPGREILTAYGKGYWEQDAENKR